MYVKGWAHRPLSPTNILVFQTSGYEGQEWFYGPEGIRPARWVTAR